MNNLYKWLHRICIFLMVCICVSAYQDFRTISPNKDKSMLLWQKIHAETTINLDKEIRGDWDSVLLIGGYTSKREVKKATHVNIKWLHPYHSRTSEENILVFCKGRKVVDYVRLSHIGSSVNWDKEASPMAIKKIPRNKAVFHISQTEDKYLHLPHYLLEPVS